MSKSTMSGAAVPGDSWTTLFPVWGAKRASSSFPKKDLWPPLFYNIVFDEEGFSSPAAAEEFGKSLLKLEMWNPENFKEFEVSEENSQTEAGLRITYKCFQK